MKTTFTFCLLLALSLTGYSQKKSDMKFLVSPGQEKLNSFMVQTREVKYFAPYETLAIKNTAQASQIFISQNEDWKNWILSEREIPEYYPGTTLIKELLNSYYLAGDDVFFDYRKTVYEYDNEQRPTKTEYYYATEDKGWELMSYIVQEFDFRGNQIYYAYYYRDWETNQMVLIYGYKAEDEYNQNDILVSRTWFYYYWDQWIPDYKEDFILNENNVVVEIYFAWYNDMVDGWQYDSWMVLTLNNDQEWAEAIMHTTSASLAKPIYLLGSGTEAGWNNNAALEMSYLGEGEFGILAYLRENGDMIKFISQLGQWTPQWGYGGSGDEWSGTLSYRPTESVPDPPPVMITNLTPGEYLIFADTANLFYDIYSMDDWDIIKKRYQKNKEETEWIPYMKATDLEWYDFEMLKPENIVIWYNTNIWKDANSGKSKNEPIWIKEEKLEMSYNDIGLPVSEIYYYWSEDYWLPEYKNETTYDHLYNIVYKGFEYWNESGEDWIILYGLKVSFSHNSNGSVNSYIVSYFSDWDKGFVEIQKYDYFYAGMHMVNILINPENAGTVTGAGSYGAGDNVFLVATPNNNYVFHNWTINDEEVHIAHEYAFIMPDNDLSLTANFILESSVDEPASNTLLIYPNPARESVYVQLPPSKGIADITIYAMDGSVVMKKQIDKPDSGFRLSTSHLKPGVYILRINTTELTVSVRLMIQ